MLNPKIEKALNEQINAEFYSAFLYLSMSNYFERLNLPGFANWTYVQYLEESTHALKILKFMNERGGAVKLQAIKEPPTEWSSPVDVFENIYKHEQHVTALIHSLVELSIHEKDYATNSMLQWFINEQVEEEASASLILEQTKRVADSKNGIFMIDRELSARVFNDATGTINPTTAGA
jgi:ferritin